MGMPCSKQERKGGKKWGKGGCVRVKRMISEQNPARSRRGIAALSCWPWCASRSKKGRESQGAIKVEGGEGGEENQREYDERRRDRRLRPVARDMSEWRAGVTTSARPLDIILATLRCRTESKVMASGKRYVDL